MATYVTHYMVDGHLACGRQSGTLLSTTETGRVKCRNCRDTEAFKEARRTERNAARRARKAGKGAHGGYQWRAAWLQRLTEMPGLQRLPRGFKGQPYV